MSAIKNIFSSDINDRNNPGEEAACPLVPLDNRIMRLRRPGRNRLAHRTFSQTAAMANSKQFNLCTGPRNPRPCPPSTVTDHPAANFRGVLSISGYF
jgi:hypothetical protein